ncbi:MAG TPA: PCYCGC motif-containing (lipo)protein [Candidatus Limnocylindria bacterium]
MRRRRLLMLAGASVAAACTAKVTEATPGSAAVTPLPALAANPAAGQWPAIIGRAPAEVREAYEFAVASEKTLRWIPCYCGCGMHGDRDNFDCYVNEIRGGGWLVLDDHALT